MHPLTCYAGQISLCHAKIEKISKKFFVMINKDGGGGTHEMGHKCLDFMGHSCYEGDIELMGAPTGETLMGLMPEDSEISLKVSPN